MAKTPRKRGGRGKPSGPLLEKLGRQFEGVMRADLKGAFATFAKGVDYDAMADAVYSGDYRRVFETIDVNDLRDALEKGLTRLGDVLLEANRIETGSLTRQLAATNPDVAQAADRAAERAQAMVPVEPTARGGSGGGRRPPPPGGFATMDLPGGGIGPDPSLLPTIDNDRVLGYVGTRTGELIQNVTADLQTNVQNAVAVGMTNNLSPRQVAGLIRDGLPLNNRQQGALNKYVAGLGETNLSAKRKTELTERYRNALVDTRATTIARTESQYAINYGQAVSWNEAQRQGLIGYRSLVEWVTEQEPCEKICRPMSGVRRLINEPFTLPNGVVVMHPPGHVNCRCGCRLISET